MVQVTRAYNGTTAYLTSKGIDSMALKVALLADAGDYDATHATIDQMTNGTSGNATVTMTIATPGVVTWTGHGLSDGAMVLLTTTGALPTGLTPGGVYFVVGSATNTFQLAATSGGAAIATSGSQSGVHTAFHIGSYEVSGNGWTPGGEALTGVAVTTVTTNDALIDADNVVVTASGGQIGFAYGHVFYDSLTGRVIKHTDYGEAWRAGDGTDFKINIPNGLYNLNYTPA